MLPKLATRRLLRLGLAFIALLAVATPLRAQTIDPLLWIANGRTSAMARSGNTLYVGGSFTIVGPRTGGGMPVDTATAVVTPAAPAVRGDVRVAIADGAGGWYIGGVFDSVGTVARQNLAHIRADLTVSGWNPGANNQVNAMALAGDRIIVGGTFTFAGGQSRARVASLDLVLGAALPWNPSPNGQIDGIAVMDTTVYLGGWFNFIGATGRNYLGAVGLQGGSVLAWNPGANTFVNFLKAQGGRIYIGGQFVTVGGLTRNRAAAFDAATGALLPWAPQVTSASSTVTAILDDGDRVYLGGSFTTVEAQGRLRLACVDSDSGKVLPWNAQLNGQVLALAMVNGQLRIGGVFTSVRSTRRYYAACLDTAAAPISGEGALLPWSPNPSGTVYAFSLNGADLYTGGTFSSIGGLPRLNAAAFDMTTGQATAFDPGPAGTVNAVVVAGGAVYLGGSFLSTSGAPSFSYLGKFDALTGAGQAWSPLVSGTVNELLSDGTTLWLGGSFLSVNSITRTRLAAIDLGTQTLLPFDSPASGQVNALARAGGLLYVGGSFTNLGGQTRNRIGAVDEVTGTLQAWDPNSGGTVNVILPTGTTVLVGGNFNSIGGQPRAFLAELDAVTGLATTWAPAPSSTVEALELNGTTLYCGGSFTTIGGQGRVRLAALDRVTGLATAWNPSIQLTSVLALNTWAGRVFFSGQFLTVNGISRINLAALYDPALPVTGVPGAAPVPNRLALAPLAPDPLRSHGVLRFTLASASAVTLDLLDIHGRRVRSLIARSPYPAGTHAVAVERGGLAAGVYFAHLSADGAEAVRRFVALP